MLVLTGCLLQTEVLNKHPQPHQLQGVANQATEPPQFPEEANLHGIFYRARTPTLSDIARPAKSLGGSFPGCLD